MPTVLPVQSGYGGPGRFRYVVFAVKHYHKRGLEAGMEYIGSNFRNREFRHPNLSRYTGYLYTYDRVFRDHPDWEYVLIRPTISLGIFDDFMLTGEVGRVDLIPDGFNVWLFAENEVPGWRNELRMPILQAYFADELATDHGVVNIGVYSFDNGRYDLEHFDKSDLDAAMAEIRHLAAQVPRPPSAQGSKSG